MHALGRIQTTWRARRELDTGADAARLVAMSRDSIRIGAIIIGIGPAARADR